MLFISGHLIFSTYHKFLDEPFSGKHIGVIVIYLIFPTLLFILTLKWKIVIVSTKHIDFIYPLRFKKKRIEKSKIKSISWRLWGNYRSPDFRIIDIETSTNEKIKISDLEFQNFDSIESMILQHLPLKQNLSTSKRIKYDQAKYNIILTLTFLGGSGFIGFLCLKTVLTNSEIDNAPITILIICTLLFLGYVFQLIEYLKRINNKA